jgi:hypothetical protein
MGYDQQGQAATPRVAEIDGTHYFDDGRGVMTRALPPGGDPGDAHITTPHPDGEMRAAGWRLAWIFIEYLALLACVCVVALLLV